jgi:hypothetical protein
MPVVAWDFFVICRVLHSSKSHFDKLKAPSLPRGDGGEFGAWDF